MKREKIIGIIIKVVAIVASIYGIFSTTVNFNALTYFTNLSNIAIDIGLLVSLILLIADKKPCKVWYVIKFMLTTSIFLTFAIFLTLLAPTDSRGIWGAYAMHNYGSLCLHFITPVLAIIDFIFFDYEIEHKKRYALFGVVPPLIYVGYIIILAQCFGYRWGVKYAPYNFLNFGAECGWWGIIPNSINETTLGIGVAYMLVIVGVIFVAFGLLLLLFSNLRKKALDKVNNK